MPVTTLDPTTALVVIDLQAATAAVQGAHPLSGVIGNASRLAAAFRERALPVVLVTVAGGAPGRTDRSPGGGGASFPPEALALVPEMDAQADDILIVKRTWGAFAGTELERILRAAGVTQIVLAGVSTSIGVESTAREAHALGFHVTLATDAMTDRLAQSHEHSVAAILPRLGETGSTDEVLALLAARA